MTLAEFATANLLSVPILCFALGALAVLVRSDLKLPEQIAAMLSVYLMLAIGLKGGAELSGRSWTELAAPVMTALTLGCAIPLWCYALLRRYCGLSIVDSAALSAHYGSVSAVTFAAVITLLDRQAIPYAGYSAALLAIMEVPAIVVAIVLSGVATLAGGMANKGGTAVLTVGGPRYDTAGLSNVLTDALSSKSILLLAGGLAIGALCGPTGLAKVKPLFVDLFPGALCLFLLELGRSAACRISDFKGVGVRLTLFAVAMPVVHGCIGILLAYAIGMSQGTAIVFGTLAASASYIAAPAAVRAALPEANPAYYLTCSLAITFPFNIVIGIPLYAALAAAVYA